MKKALRLVDDDGLRLLRSHHDIQYRQNLRNSRAAFIQGNRQVILLCRVVERPDNDLHLVATESTNRQMPGLGKHLPNQRIQPLKSRWVNVERIEYLRQICSVWIKLRSISKRRLTYEEALGPETIDSGFQAARKPAPDVQIRRPSGWSAHGGQGSLGAKVNIEV